MQKILPRTKRLEPKWLEPEWRRIRVSIDQSSGIASRLVQPITITMKVFQLECSIARKNTRH